MNKENILVRKHRKIGRGWNTNGRWNRKTKFARERRCSSIDFEEAPIRQPMRQSNRTHTNLDYYIGYGYVYFSVSPLMKFLYSNIGNDFDEIYSEYRKKVPNKYFFHYKSNIFFYVEKDVYFDSDGFVCKLSSDRFLREQKLYVHPLTNKLEMVELNLAWEGLKIADFQYKKGNTQYTIQQILTSADLKKEGKVQNHCAYTYLYSCKMRETSVWSLTVSQNNKPASKVLTIEVMPAGEIIQIRGYRNRFATDDELKIVKSWAITNGLVMPTMPKVEAQV